MLGRRKRDAVVETPRQEVYDPDVSQSRVRSWGGRPVAMKIGDKLVDSHIVDLHRDSFVSGSTAEHTDITEVCALHTLGAGATSEAVVPEGPAGYVLENHSRIFGGQGGGPIAISEGLAQAEEVSGPITIVCKDSQGAACPKAGTCEFVADYADKQFYVVTGVATVAINHYESPDS